jgi:uncharacterized OB-fold protein
MLEELHILSHKINEINVYEHESLQQYKMSCNSIVEAPIYDELLNVKYKNCGKYVFNLHVHCNACRCNYNNKQVEESLIVCILCAP